MTKQQLIEKIQSDLKKDKDYRKQKESIWLEEGINLDEVDYKAPSSQAYLTNAHRNDTSIRLNEWFLEQLHEMDNQ